MVISLKDSDFVLVVSDDPQPTVKVMSVTNDSDITDEAIGGNRKTADLVRDMCCAIRALIDKADNLESKLINSRREKTMPKNAPQNSMFLDTGATPLTAADALIRECTDRDWLEDVVFYIGAYIKREYGER